jgi:hypothetical protein
MGLSPIECHMAGSMPCGSHTYAVKEVLSPWDACRGCCSTNSNVGEVVSAIVRALLTWTMLGWLSEEEMAASITALLTSTRHRISVGSHALRVFLETLMQHMCLCIASNRRDYISLSEPHTQFAKDSSSCKPGAFTGSHMQDHIWDICPSI